MADFLHGTETIEVDKNGVTITEVKSAVVGIVGTAPIQNVAEDDRSVNEIKLCLSEKDDAKYFGEETEGYTLPKALKAIRKNGGTVLAINVFDPEKHKSGESGSETPDPTAVTAADIIGSVSAAGVRTGLKLFEEAMSRFGYNPKIILAPEYNTATAVRNALQETAEMCKGVALIDAPVGASFSDAIEARGTSGDFDLNTSSPRLILCYPHVYAPNAVTAEDQLEPLSNYAASTILGTDNNRGYHVSPSNKEIKGITGLETNLTAQINDPNCEVNQLNAAGYVTVFNGYGTGFRLWGNRSAAFPTSSKPETFICVRRTADMIEESIMSAALELQDEPGTKAWIDAVVGSVNRFLNTLVARGAIVDGSCWFPDAVNTTDTLAAGHYTFDYDFMPPTPAERITFRACINKELLASLLA
jgi:phage tail sheath protein FI|nr:MAG TPA: sheath tube [Caudoviricetes sp.]